LYIKVFSCRWSGGVEYLSTIKPESAGVDARAIQIPGPEQDIKHTLMDQEELHFSI
jgi:hypothetical protein